MKKIDFKKIKNWAAENKQELVVLCYGTGMLIAGCTIGYRMKKDKVNPLLSLFKINPISDSKAKAKIDLQIRWKKPLSYEEIRNLICKGLEEHKLELEASGLSKIDVLLRGDK